MKTCFKVMLGGVLGAFGAFGAGEVLFTGGHGTLDLSDAENWSGGAVPGTEDVAWVDLASFPSPTLTNSSDFAVGGLVFSNVPPSTVFASDNAVTIGAAGLCCSYPSTAQYSNITFKVRLAAAAAQVWDFGRGTVTFNNPIGGTSELVISNALYAIHNVAPEYNGTLWYKTPFYAYARLVKPGKWADDFRYTGAGRVEFTFTDAVAWSSIFPQRTLNLRNDPGYSGSGTFLLTQPGAPVVTFSNGDIVTNTTMFVVDSGKFLQTGGHLGSSVQVGYSTYDSLWQMTGGTAKIYNFEIANGTTDQWAYPKVVIDGGDVTAQNVLFGYRGASGYRALARNDFTIKSGSFTVAEGSGADAGLVLCYSGKDSWRTGVSSPSLAYRQTGGTTHTPRVVLGGYVSASAENRVDITNSYVTLDVRGGTFELGSRGMEAGSRWNVGTATDSWYKVSFGGGTLAAYADTFSRLDVNVPSNATPLVIDSRDHRVDLQAPVRGDGAIEKRGTGTLLLSDATRFTGSLAVKEGRVKLLGAPGGEIPAYTCYAWRAEDAAQGLDDGDDVDSWTDTSGTRVASHQTFANNPVTIPTVEENAFGALPGVRFEKSALRIPAASNPLAGMTNWTIALVYKTSMKGLGSNAAWYLATGLLGREEGGVVNDWGVVLSGAGYIGGGIGMAGCQDNSIYTTTDRADGKPHVVLYSTDGSGNMFLSADGEYRKVAVNYRASDHNPRNKSDIYIGVHNIADSGGPKKFAFTGTFAEIRFYPGTTLSAGEMAAVGSALASKYGAPVAACASLQTLDDRSAAGDMVRTEDPAMPDDGAAAWDADSVDAEDGATVSSWPSVDGTLRCDLASVCRYNSNDNLGSAAASCSAPTLLKGAINGHNVLYFAGSQTLAVPAADSPVSGATSWTAAAVFRTTNPILPTGTTRYFFNSSCIFGAELPTNLRGDWGLGLWGDGGRILAGYGGKNIGADQGTFGRPWDLNDGQPHCVVYTANPDTGWVSITVDGVPYRAQLTKTKSPTPRDAVRVLIGSGNCDYFFRGEIAAFRLYGEALDETAVAALSRAWCARYNIPAPQQREHASGESGAFGLGARTITVDAGAELVLPTSTTAPFALADGQSLSGAGTVKGTLGVSAGGVLDLTATMPALDGIWLRNGGVVKASFNQASPLPLGSFRADGTPVVRMVDKPNTLPPKLVLFTYTGEANLDQNLAWTVEGASRTSSVKVSDGRVTLVTAQGSTVILR